MTDSGIVLALALAAALGCGVMAGLFFTFSVFMMKALDRLPGTQGLATMQAINTAIITPLFLLAFLGTAALSAALAVISLVDWDGSGSAYLLVGSLLYLLGVIVLTGGYHVPRNDALAVVDPESPEAPSRWSRYMADWTRWNHVRSIASLAALALLIMAIRAG
jgi:uncharacterized membrane protein